MTEAQQRQVNAERDRLRWHIAARLDDGAPAGALIEALRAALEGMRGGDTLAAVREGQQMTRFAEKQAPEGTKAMDEVEIYRIIRASGARRHADIARAFHAALVGMKQ